MFDTVNFWLDSSISEGCPFDILPYLTNVTERKSELHGYSAIGKMGDYTATIYKNGISLKGSLAKFFLPSNLYTLTRQATGEAIEQMSDLLHLDIAGAKVTRLDISTVLPMTRPPSDYYSSLGATNYYCRVEATKNTLYYNLKTDKRQMVFYDKNKEAVAKRAIIPPTLIGCNLLRYELRYKTELNRQLKQSEPIIGKRLFESSFYYSMIQNWKNEFDAIKKINQLSTMTNNIKTPKEAQEALFARLLQHSGQIAIDDYLADLRANKTFADPKYYTRLKAELNRIMQAPEGAKGELIKELETAISNVAKYAR